MKLVSALFVHYSDGRKGSKLLLKRGTAVRFHGKVITANYNPYYSAELFAIHTGLSKDLLEY